MTTAGDPVAAEYGPVFASYRGHGTLWGKSQVEARCTFSAFQLRDGKVVVLTKVSKFENPWLSDVNAVESLDGTTADGQALSAKGLFEIGYLPSLTSDEPGIYGAYHCRELAVRHVNATERAPHSSHFALTNFTFGSSRLAIVHPWAAGHVQVVHEHRERMRQLGVLRTIDVRAKLVLGGPDHSRHALVASDVCSVLSLACGTNVQWIARTSHSEAGTVLEHYHGSHVTKSYSPLVLIDPRAEHDIPRFVEAALPAYVARKSRWNLTRCLLAFLDARAEADFLESRGLKLAVVMEMVKDSFIAGEGWAEFVPPPSEFAKLRPTLKDSIAPILSQSNWQESERAIAYESLSSLNRVPFKNHLAALCKQIDLPLSPADIRLFVRCRNSLVHRGRFYCQPADDDDRRACQPHASPTEEYFWLLHVMDRLFLRLVDHRGPWIDWSEVGNPKRRE